MKASRPRSAALLQVPLRRVAMWAGLACLALGSVAFAQDAPAPARAPVVVELYTSQGCSSCPPADEILSDLAQRDGVIALALHVDYWDYIGWKDIFAQPEHALRQRGFARRAGKRMVYTPQMIIDGQAHVIGNKPMEVAETILAHGQSGNPLQVTLSRAGETLVIRASGDVSGAVDVHLVRFSPRETVEITRGENRGRTMTYANVVRSFDTVGTWDGEGALFMDHPMTGDLPVAVLLQAPDHGPILGAAQLR